ncbi:MAG: hypothetical protein JWP27_1422 [Flaviaesturariibacter sp.]|nr:hypothetical protein [Flaviaesturariibacter sp.]
MKKTILATIAAFAALASQSQEPADALRFSWTVTNGTARHQAIGGAMGSLGGDITAAYVNPAGLGFYKTGDAVFSPSYRFGRTRATFLGRTEKEKDGKLDFGTTGFVFGGGTNQKANSVALSLSINTTANFRNDVLYRGVNKQSSYSQRFLEEINNANVKDGNIVASEYPYGTSLAFNTFWIDTVGGGTNGNFQFQSRAARLLPTGLAQEQRIEHRGGAYEGALGLAANLNNKLFLGGSLGGTFLNYRRESTFTEADMTSDTSNKFDFASFREDLQTKGFGLTLRLGVIYKPSESWRLGFAFHTPTVYSLTDYFSYEVRTNTESYKGLYSDYSVDYTNGQKAQNKYLHVTPYRVIGSISYVLREIQDVTRQRGFLTADVEYVNYKASSYIADTESGVDNAGQRDYFKQLNKAIDQAYKGAFNFRVGGELKFTTLMVRAGAAYYGNPYKEINGGSGSKLNLSGGLGYRNKGFFVDLTYVHSMVDDIHTPYRLQNASYPTAQIKSTVGNVVATIGCKF